MGRKDRVRWVGQSSAAASDGLNDALRLDRWLWCVRLFKTRALASEAIAAGRVEVDGVRARPARGVRVGDQLTVSLEGRQRVLDVLGLPIRRGPAVEARACYQETAESQANGLQWQEAQRLAALSTPHSRGRPDKKERRTLLAFARERGRR